MKNEIETLLDLKNLLASVDEEVLADLCIGHNFEGDCEVTVITLEDKVDYSMFEIPQIKALSEYIKKICEAHERTLDEKDDLSDTDHPISVEVNQTDK